MYKYFYILLVAGLFTGCSFFNNLHKSNSDKILKTKNGINDVRVELSKNTDSKLKEISTLASGTEYSLKQLTNPPVEVKTALDFNTRIINIAGNPNLNELNKIKQLTDLLNSEVESEKQRGLSLLKKKDQEIIDLQRDRQEIEDKYELQIKNLETQATNMAKKADKLQVVVNEVNSWMGLGGVVYGLKRFISLAIFGIFIFMMVFIGLRFMSTVNPIAGAIFSIFEHMAGYCVSIIKGIAPKAVEFSKHIELDVFNEYESAMTKIVKCIETLKTLQKKTGVKLTFDDVITQIDKDMNDSDKILITKIKSDIKYGG